MAYNCRQNVILLVDRGAQVEAADEEGRTPVDYANGLEDGKRDPMLAALTGTTYMILILSFASIHHTIFTAGKTGSTSERLANPSKPKTHRASSKVCTTL